MPELPELEIIKDVLNTKIINIPTSEIQIRQPLVLRCTLEDFISLKGDLFTLVRRKGKFLIFQTKSGKSIMINPMLTGRCQLAQVGEKLKPRTCVQIRFESQIEFRYYDSNLMGKIYLVQDDFSSIPKYSDMGPEANDPNLTLEVFKDRIKKHRGMIKNVLTNYKFIAGVGNAYADEILFAVGILPDSAVNRLQSNEIQALHSASSSVLNNAIEVLRERMGDKIDDKIRDFLKVHNKGGEACPQCGGRISEIRANQRITSFCRNCQR